MQDHKTKWNELSSEAQHTNVKELVEKLKHSYEVMRNHSNGIVISVGRRKKHFEAIWAARRYKKDLRAKSVRVAATLTDPDVWSDVKVSEFNPSLYISKIKTSGLSEEELSKEIALIAKWYIDWRKFINKPLNATSEDPARVMAGEIATFNSFQDLEDFE